MPTPPAILAKLRALKKELNDVCERLGDRKWRIATTPSHPNCKELYEKLSRRRGLPAELKAKLSAAWTAYEGGAEGAAPPNGDGSAPGAEGAAPPNGDGNASQVDQVRFD